MVHVDYGVNGVRLYECDELWTGVGAGEVFMRGS